MEDRRDSEIVDAFANALDDALAKHEKARMTRWLVLIEVIDESGNYGLWTIGGPDSKPWDILGMLEYAKTVQKGEIYLTPVGSDDDD